MSCEYTGREKGLRPLSTSIPNAQGYATKLALNNLFIYLDKIGECSAFADKSFIFTTESYMSGLFFKV